jgi:hypothetical protein
MNYELLKQYTQPVDKSVDNFNMICFFVEIKVVFMGA